MKLVDILSSIGWAVIAVNFFTRGWFYCAAVGVILCIIGLIHYAKSDNE